MTAEHAGPKAAAATFWLTLLAYWCAGLTIIIGAIVLAVKFLLPYVATLSRVPIPQMGNVALSFVIATAVVGVATVWLLKTFKRTRVAVEGLFATRLDELTMDVNALRNSTDARVSELLRILGNTADRVQNLLANAAHITSVNEALSKLHDRTPIGRPPESVPRDNYQQWALARMMDVPTARSVGNTLKIHDATYGVDGGPEVNVTEMLEECIRDNQLRLKVTNQTMGGKDPARGREKRLWVRFEVGGQIREVTISEGDDLEILP